MLALHVEDGVLARCRPRLAIVGMPADARGLLKGGSEVRSTLPVGDLDALAVAHLQAQLRAADVIDVPRLELCARHICLPRIAGASARAGHSARRPRSASAAPSGEDCE